ncbi:UDP-glycosyltransferase 92A1-like [Herrania umbratica]|uniref:Glycosyltransferase n=1 Tax=Herrania umbratica TaxID=108875 RepID=A0A6J1A717_9ROSI|nr:UDP-glycosyltransferase 92A1-like [Herrania umbratica]
MGGSTEHIVMLPLMAHGHLIPFLALAREIHQRKGFTITIVSTPLNIKYLRSTICKDSSSTTDLQSAIHLAELPFCCSGLPPNSDNTENLHVDQIGTLLRSTISLETPFHRLLLDIIERDGKPPMCVISDFFMGWAVDVAKAVGTSNVTFTPLGAYGTLAYSSSWLNVPHGIIDSEEFHLPGFPDTFRFPVSILTPNLRMADGNDSWSRIIQPQILSTFQSLGYLCHTVEELEPLALAWLRKYTNLPVWPVGPLLPQTVLNNSSPSGSFISKQRTGKESGISLERCLEWLDSHRPASVLYISFGSQNAISQSQMMNLATGLENSKTPFIWVIRPPRGFDLRGEFKTEWLPENFEDRMRESKQGLLVKNWAPQLEILMHKSTGAFLSHCGWNSVLESLSLGVPIIGWPLEAEQIFNCKMLVEEMGVCVELTRGAQSTIEGGKVEKVTQMVMDKEGKGGEMKRKAVETGKKIRAAKRQEGEEKGSSIKALDDFVAAIIAMRQRPCVGSMSNE